jgi:hypothetical protein
LTPQLTPLVPSFVSSPTQKHYHFPPQLPVEGWNGRNVETSPCFKTPLDEKCRTSVVGCRSLCKALDQGWIGERRREEWGVGMDAPAKGCAMVAVLVLVVVGVGGGEGQRKSASPVVPKNKKI